MPFVMKAGKALNERKVEVRVQYKPPAAPIHGKQLETMRNELVVRRPASQSEYFERCSKEGEASAARCTDAIATRRGGVHEDGDEEAGVGDEHDRERARLDIQGALHRCAHS